ncbi:MAG: peptide chain release factor 3, partial [Rubrobacter sp.]|nr:peptide chain release factor 3 [Rubrobacter sp.]
MISASDIQNLRTRLEGLGESVLTVYLEVNAARPENQGQAYLIRLKNALNDLDAPEELKNRVFETVEGEKAGGRTLVLFAAGDD